MTLLLCALADTLLSVISVVFLLVGHTHKKLDRLCSRISVALRGNGYFTVVGLLREVHKTLKYLEVRSSHLGQVWQWAALCEGGMPGNTYHMHMPSPAHAFRVFTGHRSLHAVETMVHR